ncbi:MAG: class I SAM-dependent methyltransferase [Methylovulum sp.]|nr:class I SAM-dependent methyltransferase [Methylovulum sp.]MCF7997459.1 class I SAM-dependent methyltransferase [Methylovulum sp.]
MIINPTIEHYQYKLLKNTDNSVLIEMEGWADKNNFPIVGRLVGVFLEMMAKSINAERVFEFGSGYGYSAYWFAKAVGAGGSVVCTEADYLNKDKAEQFLRVADLWSRVDFQVGLAETLFARTSGYFDICYNDVDKIDYPSVWLMAKERIRPGGLYIADNVLWRGRVALENSSDVFPGWTQAIMAHNELIFNDPDFDAFINPNRDGVLVARRKSD